MVQIFGTKKCKETQKALRFFKERNIKNQFIDLTQKGFSAGELKSISQNIPLEKLIDEKSKEYEKKNLAYMNYDVFELLLENPLVIKTPVVRYQKQATLGCQPNLWQNWV